jgi:SAM-dependent methyltransferase
MPRPDLPPPDELLDSYQGSPRPTLMCALDLWGRRPPGFAIDLGCGPGNDTVELLRLGWRVLAIDRSPDWLDLLRRRPLVQNPERLEIRTTTFEAVAAAGDLPEADLFNASFALPFCERPVFPAFWQLLCDRLRPTGLFAGNLFGPNDGWGDKVTRFAAEPARALFADFDILAWQEQEFDGKTKEGELKHWHVFDIVAEKSAAAP